MAYMVGAKKNPHKTEMSLTRGIVNVWIEQGNLYQLRAQDPAELEKCLDKNADLKYDNQALIATKHGQVEVLRFLHERGVPINGVGVAGMTLPQFAAEYGHVNILEFLIAKGVPMNGAERTAANEGHVLVLKFLAKNGTALDGADAHGYTAAHSAAVDDQVGVLKFLRSKSVNIVDVKTDRGYTPVHIACVNNAVNSLRYFKTIGARFDLAVANGDLPVHFAAMNGNVGALKFLIEEGVPLNRRDHEERTVMHLAAISGVVGALKLLVAAGGSLDDTDKFGFTPLHIAAGKFNEDAVRFMVSKGANVNARDENGETPLFEAVRVNDPNAISLLCELGADVNARSAQDKTAVLEAAANGHLESVQQLHKLGADFTLRDDNGWGVAYCAVYADRPQLLRFLKGVGVSLSVADALGETPMHFAVRRGLTECVRTLIELGESLAIRTPQFRRTPFAVLTAQTPAEVIRMMVASGAPGPDDADGDEKLTAKATDPADVAELKQKLQACPTRIQKAFAAAAELEGGIDFVLRAIMNRAFDDELDNPVARNQLAAYGRSLIGAQKSRKLTQSETNALELVPRLTKPPGPTNFEFLPPWLKDQIRTLLLIGKRTETLDLLEELPFLPPELWILIFSHFLIRQPPPLPARRTTFVHLVI